MLYYICQTGTSSKNVMEDSRKQEQQAQLKGVLEYIRDHYGEHICQDKVAEQFYFSKSYFPKCFKRYTGLSFAEYITRYRVEQARIALLSTEDSVLEIALRCGFCDSRRLILNFKKQYELTPAMYRKKIKEPAQK